MHQFHSLIHPLNNNVLMHAPVNLSSPLVKWILPLDLPFVTAVWLPHSRLRLTVINGKPQSFKVIHWVILFNQKVIWKFTMTRCCSAFDMIYYVRYAPLRNPDDFFTKLFLVNKFLPSLKLLLTYSRSLSQYTMILAEIVHVQGLTHLFQVWSWKFILS